LTVVASHTFDEFTVEVIDAMEDYVNLLKQIFDFDALRTLVKKPGFKFLFDALNGGKSLKIVALTDISYGSFCEESNCR
jgi:phosphoglucomutase